MQYTLTIELGQGKCWIAQTQDIVNYKQNVYNGNSNIAAVKKYGAISITRSEDSLDISYEKACKIYCVGNVGYEGKPLEDNESIPSKGKKILYVLELVNNKWYVGITERRQCKISRAHGWKRVSMDKNT